MLEIQSFETPFYLPWAGMPQVEEKAESVIITDRKFGLKTRKYIEDKKSSISIPVQKMWEIQAEVVTAETTRKALETGKVPKEWKSVWRKKIREFVRETIEEAWLKAIAKSGGDVALAVNRIQRKDYEFDMTMTSIKGWVDHQGGVLIVDLTAQQFGSIHALLQHQIVFQVTSPYILAERIKPLVGLTKREVIAVARAMSAAAEEGLPAAIVNKQGAMYANTLHQNRAARIARTELSNGYNFGHLDSLKKAASEGWLQGTPEKDWIAGGQKPCDICLANQARGYIGLKETFPSGHQHATAHPFCQCSLGSRIRR